MVDDESLRRIAETSSGQSENAESAAELSNVYAQLRAGTAALGNPSILSDVFIDDSSCGMTRQRVVPRSAADVCLPAVRWP
jgi:hypothetical protein